MIKTAIEKLAGDIGFDIAHSDDVVQGDLLNGLGRGFKTYSSHELGTQLAYISDKLNKDAEKFVLELAEMIKCKNNG